MKIKVKEMVFEKGLYLVLGYNGSGKTTLLTSIFLGEPYFGNDVFYNDINAKDMSKKELLEVRKKMIYLKSSSNLISYFTPNENITFLTKSQQNMDIFDKNSKISVLSGGEEELLSSYLLNIEGKEIILLDEVTNYLDKDNLNSVLKSIEEASKDKIVIFATHDERVKFSDCVTYNIKGLQRKTIF